MTRDLDEALRHLKEAIPAIEPYGSQVVLAGGLVPILYREHYQQASHRPIGTKEVDFATLRALPIRGQSIAENLAERGFHAWAVPGFALQPGRHQYQLDPRPQISPNYVEFLVTGSHVASVTSQAGLVAQSVPDLDLLFHEPIAVVTSGGQLWLPQPACFVIQKVTAWKEREPLKKAKNLAYIYDVCQSTQPVWVETAASLARLATSEPAKRALLEKRMNTLAKLFEEPAAEGPVAVEREYRGQVSTQEAFDVVQAWLRFHLPSVPQS